MFIRKSVSDQKFKNRKLTTGKDVSFKCCGNDSTYILQKVHSNKSESSIHRSLIASEDQMSDSSNSDSQLIPTPRTPKQPKEILRRSLLKLKSTYCNESLMALRDLVQISRFNPQLLQKSMPVVYKGITTLLKSLRPTTVRTACQAANELFMNVSSEQGPEFDELVHLLLQKTADGNKHLRKDASEALDSMVIHVSPYYSVRILLHRKISGCSLPVRTTAAKLLACVANILGSNPDITVNEETKTRLVQAAIRFMQDDCHNIRFHGMRLATLLWQRKDYEDILQSKISVQMLKKFQKIKANVEVNLRP